MDFVNPLTWVDGMAMRAAVLNEQLRGNLNYLFAISTRKFVDQSTTALWTNDSVFTFPTDVDGGVPAWWAYFFDIHYTAASIAMSAAVETPTTTGACGAIYPGASAGQVGAVGYALTGMTATWTFRAGTDLRAMIRGVTRTDGSGEQIDLQFGPSSGSTSVTIKGNSTARLTRLQYPAA
jgi:hypothetical protein